MIKFKQNYTIEFGSYEFTFKKGYSYTCSKIEDGYRIKNIDGSIMVEIIGDEVGEYLEK